jgi:peptide/nickel transport system ATP-binding protein
VPPVLEIQDLRTHIRQRKSTVEAVDGVTLHVDAGETVGLVGESGCGKTMTGLSVLRLLPPGGHIAGGSIKVDGQEVVEMSPARLRQMRGNVVSMIFQDPMTSLNPTMTVGNQIAESVRLHRRVSKKAAADRAAEVLAMVGMPRPKERLNYYPHQLSGGLRQRVMIAMALACEPKLLIADEPTTALDVTIQAQILALLDRLKAELGMGMLLITHDMGVIAGRADRVMVMYAGRIVEEAETVELFDNMHHPYTEALLASIPQHDQDTTQALYSIPGTPPDLTNPPSWCRFQPRCRYATDRCRQEDPPLAGEDPGHPYACFHPVNMEGVDPQAARSRITAELKRRPPRPELNPLESPVLELTHLVKEFPVTQGVLQRVVGTVKAVSDVTFTVARGETFGIVGESGCGKTTVGRLIVGLEKPTAGAIKFEGRELTDLFKRGLRRRQARRLSRRDMQLMFQDPYSSLDPRMRVGGILREPLVIQGIGTRREQNERVASLLREVGLRPTAVELYPHEFSGGQRQRLGLARALTVDPKLLIADEPVSALDVSIRSQILNLMRELQERHNLTYVIISHDLAVIRYMADRIGVMYLGKLVEIGPSSQVYENAAHPYTAGLIGTIPNPNPRREREKERVPVRGELPSAVSPPSGCRFRTRCPLAEDVCAEVEPPLIAFGAGHYAACHFPLQEPLSVAPAGTAADREATISPASAGDFRGHAGKSPAPVAADEATPVGPPTTSPGSGGGRATGVGPTAEPTPAGTGATGGTRAGLVQPTPTPQPPPEDPAVE